MGSHGQHFFVLIISSHLKSNQPVGLPNIVFKKSCQGKNGPIKTFKQRGRNKIKVPPVVE
jgi:hypothetical protein